MTSVEVAIVVILLHLYRHWLGPWFITQILFKIKSLQKVKLNSSLPNQEQFAFEMKWTMVSQIADFLIILLIFILYSKKVIQLELESVNIFSSVGLISLLLLFLLQDFYFYITHRILHTRWLYKKIHSIHHKPSVTNPFTSFCVHPAEKFLELLFFPLYLIFFKTHMNIFLIFIFLSTFFNFMGHSGFELKRFFFIKPDSLFTTTVFHEIHHERPNKNFSLYFAIWDNLLGTTDKDYQKKFFNSLKL